MVQFNNLEANLRYNLTPALGVGAMYTFTNLNGSASMIGTDGSSSAHWHQFALQADYALSKYGNAPLQRVALHFAAGTMGGSPDSSCCTRRRVRISGATSVFRRCFSNDRLPKLARVVPRSWLPPKTSILPGNLRPTFAVPGLVRHSGSPHVPSWQSSNASAQERRADTD